MEHTDVVVIGAGPCGLAAAIAFKRAGMGAVVLDRSCVVSGIALYPPYMTFFSTAERIAIGGMPFVVATEKPTRRDALAYYRAVVSHFDLEVRQYEDVERVERVASEAGEALGPPRGGRPPSVRFHVHTVRRGGRRRVLAAGAVVVATGYFGTPSLLGVPGETLPHVSHYFVEGHYAFRQDAVVVGGGNSAVDAALDLYRAGARVTMVHFGPGLDPNVKPWVMPEIVNRIQDGGIAGRWRSRVVAIDAEAVTIRTSPDGDPADHPREAREERLPAEHVFLTTGFLPNTALLEQLSVPLDPHTGVPEHDPETMETSVPGVFIAGVIASGFNANRIFIENGRDHGTLIARRLATTTTT
jgi:thioredoxin reductase (NADPH)